MLNVFRKHHHELCTILDTSPTTLISFTGKLYSEKLVDVATKNEVLRTKGYQGANTLLDHLALKLEYDNSSRRYKVILELMLQEEVLQDLGEKMKVAPENTVTNSMRALSIPNAGNFVEASTTAKLILFFKQIQVLVMQYRLQSI